MLAEFMGIKADRARYEQQNGCYHGKEHNSMQNYGKGQVKEEVKQEYLESFFTQKRDRANTTDSKPQVRISTVRVSFMTKKPMENPDLDSLGLQSITRVHN